MSVCLCRLYKRCFFQIRAKTNVDFVICREKRESQFCTKKKHEQVRKFKKLFSKIIESSRNWWQLKRNWTFKLFHYFENQKSLLKLPKLRIWNILKIIFNFINKHYKRNFRPFKWTFLTIKIMEQLKCSITLHLPPISARLDYYKKIGNAMKNHCLKSTKGKKSVTLRTSKVNANAF